jgi:hypothetical protein
VFKYDAASDMIADARLSNAEFLEQLLRAGVRMGQVRGQIRAVTHLDVSSHDIELALSAAADIMRAGRTKGGGLDRVTSVGY